VENWRIIVNVRHLYTTCKHKLAKIVEPLALFMLFLDNERGLMRHLVAGASQHVVEEICGVDGGRRRHLLNTAISAHGGLDSWLLGGINKII
jgi:hypothetical protein